MRHNRVVTDVILVVFALVTSKVLLYVVSADFTIHDHTFS